LYISCNCIEIFFLFFSFFLFAFFLFDKWGRQGATGPRACHALLVVARRDTDTRAIFRRQGGLTGDMRARGVGDVGNDAAADDALLKRCDGRQANTHRGD